MSLIYSGQPIAAGTVPYLFGDYPNGGSLITFSNTLNYALIAHGNKVVITDPTNVDHNGSYEVLGKPGETINSQLIPADSLLIDFIYGRQSNAPAPPYPDGAWANIASGDGATADIEDAISSSSSSSNSTSSTSTSSESNSSRSTNSSATTATSATSNSKSSNSTSSTSTSSNTKSSLSSESSSTSSNTPTSDTTNSTNSSQSSLSSQSSSPTSSSSSSTTGTSSTSSSSSATSSSISPQSTSSATTASDSTSSHSTGTATSETSSSDSTNSDSSSSTSSRSTVSESTSSSSSQSTESSTSSSTNTSSTSSSSSDSSASTPSESSSSGAIAGSDSSSSFDDWNPDCQITTWDVTPQNSQTYLKDRLDVVLKGIRISDAVGMDNLSWADPARPHVFYGEAGVRGGMNMGRLPFIQVLFGTDSFDQQAVDGGINELQVRILYHTRNIADVANAEVRSINVMRTIIREIRKQYDPTDSLVADNTTYGQAAPDKIDRFTRGPWGYMITGDLSITFSYNRNDYGLNGST